MIVPEWLSRWLERPAVAAAGDALSARKPGEAKAMVWADDLPSRFHEMIRGLITDPAVTPPNLVVEWAYVRVPVAAEPSADRWLGMFPRVDRSRFAYEFKVTADDQGIVDAWVRALTLAVGVPVRVSVPLFTGAAPADPRASRVER